MKRIETPRGPRACAEPGETNLRLAISYQGQDFSGYQSQPHAKTVQDSLQELWRIFSGGESPSLQGCSRLDAGVHAHEFVLNFITSRVYTEADCEAALRSLNGILASHLQLPIRVQDVRVAAADFHARFDSVGKHYRYLIWYGFAQHALLTPRCWAVRSRKAPSPEALQKCLKLFEGRQDFAAFRASDCSALHTVRHLASVQVWQHPRHPEMQIIDFYGEGFLKNMVRNIAGSAVDVAIGKLTLSDISEAFLHREREKTGQCAPAHALTLERVYYDVDVFEREASLGCKELLH
jgi:tRNA pseudouridine38-40 synthase